MKKTLIAGAIAAACAVPVHAQLEGDLSLGYESQYNFRGLNGIVEQLRNDTSDDAITAELNTLYKLNNHWALVGGATITNVTDGRGLDHDRYRAGVRYTNECYTLEVGYQHHDIVTRVGNNIDTGEFYARLGTQCRLTGGRLSLLVAQDIDYFDGTYVELSLNKDWKISELAKLDVTAGVSQSFGYWENLLGTGDDFNHLYVTLGVPYQAAENLVVTPHVTYSQGFGALDPAGSAEEDDEVIFGVRASVSF